MIYLFLFFNAFTLSGIDVVVVKDASEYNVLEFSFLNGVNSCILSTLLSFWVTCYFEGVRVYSL